MELLTELKISYKKLKSSIYFDKTCSINKDKIVEFEINDMEDVLNHIENILKKEEEFEWNKYKEKVLDKIQVYSFPKKVRMSDENKDKNKRSNIILNKLSKNTKVIIDNKDDIQNFINLPIEGHILGVLWILRLGKHIDGKFYNHSYGNRIKESEKKEITYSPYLFKPYFKEYQSWRDNGLKVAEECYENKKDCIVLMLDIKRFYYSVDFTQKIFEELFSEWCTGKSLDPLENMVNDRLHKFIFEVIKRYSRKMNNIIKENQNILPIGFMPSSILANWYLDAFDKNLINRVNPTYYARYVDDIIIVDKVEENSKIYDILNGKKFDIHKLIENYFIECKSSVFYGNNLICKTNRYMLKKQKSQKYIIKKQKLKENIYKIKFIDKFHDDAIESLEIQEEKVKLLYLKKEGTKTILDKFKSEIRKNSSEFRLLPEDKELFLDSYSDIYKLHKSDSVNKLRGLEELEIDKYELSKFIGKQLTIGNLVDDSKESKFYEDLAKIYDKDVVIKNYTTWEATLSLCVINYKLDKFKVFFKVIKDSIREIDTSKLQQYSEDIISVQSTLNEYLKVCVIRSLSLVWSKNVENLINELYKKEEVCKEILKKRKQYCLTRMCNKVLMPLLIDAIVKDEKNLNNKEILTDENVSPKRLNNLQDYVKMWDKLQESIVYRELVYKECKNKLNTSDFMTCLQDYENEYEFNDLIMGLKKYKYHPYVVTYEDLNRLHVWCSIKNGRVVKDHILSNIKNNIESNKENKKKVENGFKSLKNEIETMYLEINYDNKNDCTKSYKTYNKNVEAYKHNKKIVANVMNVGNGKLNELKIAVATANLKDEDFSGVLTDSPNRTLERYNEVAEIINQAVKCHANMLILPESYVPYEWITLLERESKKNNLAIITGVEHIKYNENVYNLIATILPYEFDNYNYVYTNFRTKVTYSPEEIRQIHGYRLNPVKGNEYNLFVWNNVWIPVYCCFEVASIVDRSIFYSLTDLLVTVEWNPDINYFSNIIESLSRDMHCYCAQVNSAKYGDSCIIKPCKTENKSIVRTKGGINSSILVGKVDIAALRDFQIKEYELQKDDKEFKPTPPLFNKENVILKQKNKLFTSLHKEEYGYSTFRKSKSQN